ncbi:MAG: methyltransferase domain-containing protein [Phycisphaerae bacterium]|nr:methyltransferase domain-containing protein [Phycisphaerae bacterium]
MYSNKLAGLRSEWLSHVNAAPILEVGAGSGANLSHYPGWLTDIDIAEPDEAMFRRAARRADKSKHRLRSVPLHRSMLSQTPPGTYGTVVTTFVLCSVRDPAALLREISRVLKSGGRYILIEHGASPEEHIHRWQTRLSSFHRRLFGCSLCVSIPTLLDKTPLHVEQYWEGYLNGLPRIGGYVYCAVLVQE